MAKSLTTIDVRHVAELAQLPLSKEKVNRFIEQLTSVLHYMSKIQKLDTSGVKATSQVTGLENISRQDEVDTQRMFTQQQALSNAKRQHKGFFVVKSIFHQE